VCAFPGCEKPGKATCGGCREIGYCSKEHQREHWPTHKTVCKKEHQAVAAPAPVTAASSPPASAEPTVVWEDQKRINEFGRLNNRHMELLESLKALRVKRENLVDAQDAVDELDSDDEDAVKMQVGEVFIGSGKSAAAERIVGDLARVDEELKQLRQEKGVLLKQMAVLKEPLKAKFGTNINLDYEVEDDEDDSAAAGAGAGAGRGGGGKPPAKAPAAAAPGGARTAGGPAPKAAGGAGKPQKKAAAPKKGKKKADSSDDELDDD